MIVWRLISIGAIGMSALWFGARVPSAPTIFGSVRSASNDIAFSSRRDGNWEVYAMDAAGQNQRRLTRRDAEDRFPLWSPDRRQIAFASLVGTTWELWLMDSDGRNQRRLASEIVVKSTRGWSGDNKRIVYAAGARNNTDIHLVDVSSGEVTRLTASPGEHRDPAWSPDGTHLTFSSTRDGSSHIYVMSVDGRNVRQLTSGPASDATPRWSPDGNAIVFVSDRDRTQDLYVIDAKGGSVERLTIGARVTRDPPLWSPDGSLIAFQIADGENYQVGVVRLSDRARSLLASDHGGDRVAGEAGLLRVDRCQLFAPLAAYAHGVRPLPRAASATRVVREQVAPETRFAIPVLVDRVGGTGGHSVSALAQRQEQWRMAVNARDIEAYSELVAEDVVWIPPVGDAIVGRQAFREWLEPFFEAYDYEYSASNTRFLTAGEWIAERSHFESRMTPIAGGSTMSHTGVYVVIWRRDSDGIWRIDRYVDQGPLGGG